MMAGLKLSDKINQSINLTDNVLFLTEHKLTVIYNPRPWASMTGSLLVSVIQL